MQNFSYKTAINFFADSVKNSAKRHFSFFPKLIRKNLTLEENFVVEVLPHGNLPFYYVILGVKLLIYSFGECSVTNPGSNENARSWQNVCFHLLYILLPFGFKLCRTPKNKKNKCVCEICMADLDKV